MTAPAPETPDQGPAAEIQWSALMQAAQNGDTAAYRRLLNEISPPLRRFLRSRLFAQDAVDDLLQEILMAVHTARHTYLPDQPFRHWLFGIARHKMVDYFRKQGRKDSREISGDDLVTFMADPANNPEEALHTKDLHDALRRLPDKQRQVLMLTKIQGHSMADAAATLGMSETAAKVTAHRAYKKLKEWLIADGYT